MNHHFWKNLGSTTTMIGSNKRAGISSLCAVLVVSALSAYTAEAQVGTTICACQPSTYTFTLKFSLQCADRDIQKGNTGIADASCVDPGIQVTDPFPVNVTNIVITELDHNLQTLKQDNLTVSYVDGDQFNYTSFLADDLAAVNSTTIPSGLVMMLNGVNAEGAALSSTWAIVYTNNCSDYPVLKDNNQIGWTVFVSKR